MKTVAISFLLVATLCIMIDANEENCTDFEGRSFAHGLYYVPGPSPNVCSYCVCHHGQPMWCKSIFCRTPYKCRPIPDGPRCCDFTCLDEPRINVTKSTASPSSSLTTFTSTTAATIVLILTMLRL